MKPYHYDQPKSTKKGALCPFFRWCGDGCAEPAASSCVEKCTVRYRRTRRDSERSESSRSCPVARTKKKSRVGGFFFLYYSLFIIHYSFTAICATFLMNDE